MGKVRSKKLGRPKIKDSEKVLYQRVGFEYSTFKRFKEIVRKEKEKDPKTTMSKIQEAMMDKFEAN
jgi:hypothetical protein